VHLRARCDAVYEDICPRDGRAQFVRWNARYGHLGHSNEH